MTTCIERALVDSHFRGDISPPDERRMRAHVTLCAACKSHYRRRQILAELDPEAPSPEDRLARGLGLGPGLGPGLARTASSLAERKPLFAVASALALAAALFLVLRAPKKVGEDPRDPPHLHDDGFTARGQIVSSTTSTIGVYRVADRRLLTASGALKRDDELAFSYDNASHKPYLMIFGVDEGGRVYWFYPAWTNESENPMAVKTDPNQTTAQLPEAIKHRYAGSRLTVHGLFLDQPLTVRDVEAALRDHRLAGMQGALDQTTTFEVTR